MTLVETDYFDNKCQEWIESYRFVPSGSTWIREDGVEFQGEMITPWKDIDDVLWTQLSYFSANFINRNKVSDTIAELDAALLDAEYKNIIGEDINE